MKTLLALVFVLVTISTWGQERNFRDSDDFTDWMQNYYKHPEQKHLLEAFQYGCSSKEIRDAGSQINVAMFFSSVLRSDTSRQSLFFSQLKETKNTDFIYGFGITLWLMQTEHGDAVLKKFLAQKQIEPYLDEFAMMTNVKRPDFWGDPIISPAQLDLLWADFFATGNDKSIVKIISVLPNLTSDDSTTKIIAGAAKWSLTSNAIRHDKVMAICKSEKKNSDSELTKVLDEIVSTATKQRQR